ncbi:MAG TPA: methyltransferase domain-containing protein, partial [Kiritimatiellia bacterium]|nr:methyltransferase domain-containing protein [Kiritimatiellia bacterium]
VQVRMLNPDARDLRRTRRLRDLLRWPGIELEEAGVESLDAAAGGYDAVWSLSVIEHIAGAGGDDRDAVRRLWKAVRPGGRLILTVPTDRQAWDEYRDRDAYGTQPRDAATARYFFQRFYDEAAIRARLVETIGREPARMEWFGEKTSGHFHAYIDRWRREGAVATRDDPWDIAAHYRTYPSFGAMPGAGVCGLLFIKP